MRVLKESCLILRGFFGSCYSGLAVGLQCCLSVMRNSQARNGGFGFYRTSKTGVSTIENSDNTCDFWSRYECAHAHVHIILVVRTPVYLPL